MYHRQKPGEFWPQATFAERSGATPFPGGEGQVEGEDAVRCNKPCNAACAVLLTSGLLSPIQPALDLTSTGKPDDRAPPAGTHAHPL